MTKITKYVGLDVHKEKIAVADQGPEGEVRFFGAIANTPEGLRQLVARLEAPAVGLRFCYEAGPCALSAVPRRPDDRVKTDRRDAITLAGSCAPASWRPFGYWTKRTRRSAATTDKTG